MLQALARHLLSRPGYSQHRLARELGISQAALSRLAAGAGKETLASTAFKLIEAAGGRVVFPRGVLEAEATTTQAALADQGMQGAPQLQSPQETTHA